MARVRTTLPRGTGWRQEAVGGWADPLEEARAAFSLLQHLDIKDAAIRGREQNILKLQQMSRRGIILLRCPSMMSIN